MNRPRLFFFNDTATTEIYTLSLHDAPPISPRLPSASMMSRATAAAARQRSLPRRATFTAGSRRSEEHTSELQSHLNLVCRLLLEKKKAQATEDYMVQATLSQLIPMTYPYIS